MLAVTAVQVRGVIAAGAFGVAALVAMVCEARFGVGWIRATARRWVRR